MRNLARACSAQSELDAEGVVVPPSTPVVGSAVSAARELRTYQPAMGDTTLSFGSTTQYTSAWGQESALGATSGGFGTGYGTGAYAYAGASAGSGFRHLRRSSAARAASIDGYGDDEDRDHTSLLDKSAAVDDTGDDGSSEWSFM